MNELRSFPFADARSDRADVVFAAQEVGLAAALCPRLEVGAALHLRHILPDEVPPLRREQEVAG